MGPFLTLTITLHGLHFQSGLGGQSTWVKIQLSYLLVT